MISLSFEKPFGSQIAHALSVLESKRHVVDAGLGAREVERRAKLAQDYSRVIMQIAVSLIVLTSGVYLLLTGNEPSQKLASGLIGTVVGYWLR